MKQNGITLVDRGDTGLLYKPPGFWISINGDWERWCESEHFRDVQSETICDVYLKPNLSFIKISTVHDANELVQFILPDIRQHDIGFSNNISDLINFSRYEIEHMQRGKRITQRTVWINALNSCDGIYYENSWDLHMNTIFNTWDCDSIMLFDPRNIISLVKKF